MNYNTHMKYKYGDILYHILSSSPYYAGATVVQVLEYDEIRKKYKCVNFDTLCPYSDFFIIYFYEEELDYINNHFTGTGFLNEKEYYIDDKPPFPINLDDTYTDIYDSIGGIKSALIRKSIRRRKNLNSVPIKE